MFCVERKTRLTNIDMIGGIFDACLIEDPVFYAHKSNRL